MENEYYCKNLKFS